MRKRPDKGLLAGLWEYPNELTHTMPEEWGISLLAEEFGCTAKHIFSHIEWHMTARVAEVEEDTLPEGWAWADKWEMKQNYAIPSAFDGMKRLVDERLEKEKG